jgi:hypothetical protein
MEALMILLGFGFLIITHYCAYSFGQHEGLLQALQQDPRYRCGKDGMTLREGDTLLGVVDAKQGPYFLIANSGMDINYD